MYFLQKHTHMCVCTPEDIDKNVYASIMYNGEKQENQWIDMGVLHGDIGE